MITVKRAEYLSALTCAGVKDVRYYLNGIFFDAEGFIVGTDGHRLFCGKATTEGESAIINMKAKPPAKFDHVVVDIENRSATFIDDKAQEVLTSPIDIIDGHYPDWRRVSHFKPGKVEAIGLHLPYLADAAKCSKYSKYFNKKANGVLEMQDSTGATRFRMGNDAYMLIMPVRMR